MLPKQFTGRCNRSHTSAQTLGTPHSTVEEYKGSCVCGISICKRGRRTLNGSRISSCMHACRSALESRTQSQAARVSKSLRRSPRAALSWTLR